MGDYNPVYLPGDRISMTASGTIAGGQLVEVSGSGTVQAAAFAAARNAKIVGVAANDAIANGRVGVYGRGVVHESVACGTVTAGDLVGTPVTGDTAGSQVKSIAAYAAALNSVFSDTEVEAALNAVAEQGRAVLGVALTTAANPNKVRWMQF